MTMLATLLVPNTYIFDVMFKIWISNSKWNLKPEANIVKFAFIFLNFQQIQNFEGLKLV